MADLGSGHHPDGVLRQAQGAPHTIGVGNRVAVVVLRDLHDEERLGHAAAAVQDRAARDLHWSGEADEADRGSVDLADLERSDSAQNTDPQNPKTASSTNSCTWMPMSPYRMMPTRRR